MSRLSRPACLLLTLLMLVSVACGGSAPPATTPRATTGPTPQDAVVPTTAGLVGTPQGTFAPPSSTVMAEPTPDLTGPATATQPPVALPTVAATPAALPTVATPPATGPTSPPSGRGPYPITYTDASGTKVTLVEQPRRIISLFPTNNETVFAIGAGDQVIAVDQFTSYPKEAADKPKVQGDYTRFNVEQVVALEPDLVLTSVGTEEILDKPLRDAGIKVISTPLVATVQDVPRHMRDLGIITGHTREANRVARELTLAVQDMSRRVADANKVRVYFEADSSTPGKPYTFGPGTLQDQLIRIAGGQNIFHNAKSAFPQVGYESIVAADPQVILLGNARGYVGPGFLNPTTPAEVKRRTGFSTTEAVRENRVVPINADLIGGPGPRLAQGLRQMAAAIHPELFGER